MSNAADLSLAGKKPADDLAMFLREINLAATFPVTFQRTLPSFEVEPTRAKGACTDTGCWPLLTFADGKNLAA